MIPKSGDRFSDKITHQQEIEPSVRTDHPRTVSGPGGLSVSPLTIANDISKFDLTLSLCETDDGFQGFFGWRDMPDELRQRIAADVRAVATDPVLGERLKAIGQAVRVGTTADFIAMIDEQRGKIARIVRAGGAKP